MTKHVAQEDKYYHEYYVYDGNTSIERVRRFGANRAVRDWLIFDSVEEAFDYFSTEIG